MNDLSQKLQNWANKRAACWKGYEQVGMKMLNGREVPNCVPASKDIPNSKPKKKKTEKKAGLVSDDSWKNISRYGAGGAILGALLGGSLGTIDVKADFPTSLDDFNFDRVGKHWSGGGSRGGALAGLLLGGGLGYALTPSKKDKDSKPKKKKTEKKSNSEESALASMFADVPMVCTPGLGCKRKLSPEERREVIDAQFKMFPNLFPQDPDPVSSQMSSPGWSAIGTGILGAGLLGGGVGLGAHLTNKDITPYALLAGALGGLGGGLYGYIKRKRKNAKIEALMEDLPVGADIGDIEKFSDPKIMAAISRDFQRQLIRKGLM